MRPSDAKVRIGHFTFDSVGNLTSNSLIGTYTYPAPGSARPHGVTATPLGFYGYDVNGSMTTAAGDTLTYDGENRLASVNSVQLVYGPDGPGSRRSPAPPPRSIWAPISRSSARPPSNICPATPGGSASAPRPGSPATI
jgi:hypothetical protein